MDIAAIIFKSLVMTNKSKAIEDGEDLLAFFTNQSRSTSTNINIIQEQDNFEPRVAALMPYFTKNPSDFFYYF